jgi:hypothetical protein
MPALSLTGLLCRPDLSGVALGDMYAVPNKDAYGSQPSLSSSPLSVETISVSSSPAPTIGSVRVFLV